jgi:hypothetical protein
MSIVYVRLLGEGTEVYRPVSAEQISSEIFVLSSQEAPEASDEVWEYKPGTKVRVATRILSQGPVPVVIGVA